MIRLFDDSGDAELPVLSRLTFETPCSKQQIPFETDHEVPARGGLYVAQTPEHCTAIIVPPVLNQGRGFADLAFTPHVERRMRSPNSAFRLIEIAGLWSRARLPGNLIAELRRQKVMDALVRELFRILCGENWTKAEEESISAGLDGEVLEVLSGMVSTNPTESGAGAVLIRDAKIMALQDCNSRVEHLSTVAMEYRLLPESVIRATTHRSASTGVIGPKWLVELSLRLASDPASAEFWAGRELRTGLNFLVDSPSLARAARLAVMTTDLYIPPGSSPGVLYPGWRWA